MLKDAFYRKFKYTIPLLFIVMMLGILSGCNDDENVNASESDFNNSDTISIEYYQSTQDILNEYLSFLSEIKNNKNDLDEINSLSSTYLANISLLRIKPSNDAEYNVDEYFYKFYNRTKSVAEYYMKYATSNDEKYLKIINDNHNEATSNIEVYYDIAANYGY